MGAGGVEGVGYVLTDLLLQNPSLTPLLSVGKYITHGADRPIWMYHLPSLSSSSDQAIAKSWLERVDAETKAAEQAGRPLESEKTVLTLRSGGEVDWMKDGEWMSVMGLEEVVGTKEKRYVWW